MSERLEEGFRRRDWRWTAEESVRKMLPDPEIQRLLVQRGATSEEAAEVIREARDYVSRVGRSDNLNLVLFGVLVGLLGLGGAALFVVVAIAVWQGGGTFRFPLWWPVASGVGVIVGTLSVARGLWWFKSPRLLFRAIREAVVSLFVRW